jgi:hypothetical protein
MKLDNILKVLTTPRCWIRNDPTSKAWDKELNKLLDTNNIILGSYRGESDSYYTLLVGDVEVWVSNFPYAYGSKHRAGLAEAKLPSRATVFRLREAEMAARANKQKLYK